MHRSSFPRARSGAPSSLRGNGLVRSVAVLLLGTVVACGAKEGKLDNTAGILNEETTPEGLVQQRIDLNKDGQADIFNYYKERKDAPRLLVRKEMDLNWDGLVDVRTWFDPSGAIEKEEMDGDFDSRVDWVDHYKGGRRVTSEIDTDNDGKFDLFKTYEQGLVRRKERDTNGDDRIDYWEYLDDAGNVVKTGRDVDGDGVMDVRED